MGEEITPIIELVDADVTGAEMRASTVVIAGVNWTICPGDFWVVGGLPGAGKSDLLATAAGLQKPGKGTHLLFGSDLSRLDEGSQLRQRLRVGMVFQGSGRLFQQLSVRENLGLPVCYHENISMDEAEQRVQSILNLVELAPLERRRPGILTRNIHQRIALARALMLGPEVLLIDNPLAGIDARQMYWWLKFLPRLAAGVAELMHRPITVVVGVDDFRPWKSIGTRFAVTHDKEWKVIGGREELENTNDPAVRDVLAPDFQRQES